jgi:subtilisin family serine protease
LPNCATKAQISSSRFRKILYNRLSTIAVAQLTKEEVAQLKSDSEVEAVEPDRVVSIVSCSTPVPAQIAPWGIEKIGGGDGKGKTVWVIDTGVDLDHPDLTVDASRSRSFVAGTTPDDDHGHGSHVAGIIAAKNNSIGVLGVAAGATVVSIKVMDASGKGSSSKLAEAVNYVSQNARTGDVVNMSVGGGVSEILDNAVKEAASKGIFFAVAAGNDSQDASTSSPARVDGTNVYTVSAINNEDTFASFSNYGASIDYAAPGVNIPSTFKEGGYATMSGTSMAAPHLAGILLLKGKNITISGYAKEDPDGKPDPIAHK